jgi:hypothetical protein
MPAPAEQRVLRFTKDSRLTELRLGSNPIGVEIRALVDGEFTWSHTCRTVDELREQLARIHADFLARGWTEVVDGSA